MYKPSKSREERRREILRGKIFASCIFLCIALPGWVDAVLRWRG